MFTGPCSSGSFLNVVLLSSFCSSSFWLFEMTVIAFNILSVFSFCYFIKTVVKILFSITHLPYCNLLAR